MAKANWGGGLGGAASGASAGFSVGGPVGAAVGGTLGLFGGLFGGKKKKKKPKKLSTFDVEQKRLNQLQHQSILGEGPLADLYNYNPQQANAVFDRTIGNPAYRSFREEIAPQITGQFRSGGLQNSSYAADALARRGRDVQENLDAQRMKYLYGLESEARGAKRQAVENLQNRTTFDYAPDQAEQAGGGFGIDKILSSIGGNKNFSDYLQDTTLKYLPGGV